MRKLLALALVLVFGMPFAVQADQTQIDTYPKALYLFWSKIYANGGKTIYCNQKFGSRKGKRINVEHVFPMAWVTRELKCGTRSQCQESSERFNRIESDMHNFYPSRVDLNKARGSMPFGMIRGERREFGKCDFEVDASARRVEPRPEVRGEIARAMFYMHEEYGFKIFGRLGRTLKRWHEEDPPTDTERERNDVIAKYQGTRNRFIDQPELVDTLKF